MTATTTNPPLGSEVVAGQQLGTVPGDPGQGLQNRRNHRVMLVDSVTRLVVDKAGPRSGVTMAASAVAPPGQLYVYWGSGWQPNGDTWPHDLHVTRGEYLPYPPADGIPIASSPEPVNQFAVGPKWRNVLSRFAHDVMAFNPQSNHLRDPGTHTTGHLPPTDAASDLKNKATYQLGRAVTGIAFHRVEQWMEFDAQRLAQYPAAVPDAENWLIWQDGTIPVAEDEIPIPNMSTMMAAICGDAVKEIAGLCVGAWVYLLNERIDASTYDSNMNSGGEIRLPDPAWDLWRPQLYLHRVTGTRSERSDQWAEIMGWFAAAHDHYLNSVAPSVDHSAQ